MANEEKREQLRISTEAVNFTITTEPFVIPTYRGYAPAINVSVRGESGERILFISSRSLTEIIEKAREKNNGAFKGMTLTLKKESSDRFARFVAEEPSCPTG